MSSPNRPVHCDRPMLQGFDGEPPRVRRVWACAKCDHTVDRKCQLKGPRTPPAQRRQRLRVLQVLEQLGGEAPVGEIAQRANCITKTAARYLLDAGCTVRQVPVRAGAARAHVYRLPDHMLPARGGDEPGPEVARS